MTNKIRGDFLIENLKDENSANDYTLRASSAAGVVPFYLRAHKGPGSIREPIPPPPPPFHEVLAGIATPTLSYRFADGTNHGSFGSGADLTITSDGSNASFVSDESTYTGFIGYFDVPDLTGESSGVRDGDQVAATPSIAVSNFNRRSSGAAATRSWIVVWYQASALASGRDIFKGSHTTGGAGRIVATTNSFTTAKSSIGAGPEMLAANATGSVGSAETLSNTSGKLCIVMDAWDGTDLTTYWKQTGHGVGHTKLLQPSAGNNSNHGNNAWYAAGDVNYVAYPMRTLHQSIVNSTLTADNFDTYAQPQAYRMTKDFNQIAKFEQAIQQKYGEEAIQNPKANWSEDKEQEYLEQIKKLHKKQNKNNEAKDKIEHNGFLISKKLLNKDSKRLCPTCETYSFSVKDDVYMNKFQCCFECYVQWVEGREERWATGWRPEKTSLEGEEA